MQPGFGTHVIGTGYGNGGSTNAGLPMIDSRVFVNGPTMRAPGLTSPPRMPLIEKVTPRRINATATSAVMAARARVKMYEMMYDVTRVPIGYARTAGMRVTQMVSSIRSK